MERGKDGALRVAPLAGWILSGQAQSIALHIVLCRGKL